MSTPTPPSRNAPVPVTWDSGAARLFNLVIALINSPAPRSTDWILGNVAGYDAEKLETNRKRFHRDRAALAPFGVILTAHPADDGKELWSVDSEALFLPDMDFSPEESEVLAAAARWNQSESLSEAATSAYRKLAAAGLQRGMGEAVIPSVPDHTELDQGSVEAIFRALDKGVRLQFNYYPSLLEEPAVRTVEPWAYGAVDGKIYLTGFDIDRQQQRTFRLARIAEVEALPEFSTHPAPQLPSQELIRRGLAAAGTHITARLHFPADSGAEELRALCDEAGQIGPVDRTWLVRTAAAYAPDVIVQEPQDVVDDVIALLTLLAGSSEASPS